MFGKIPNATRTSGRLCATPPSTSYGARPEKISPIRGLPGMRAELFATPASLPSVPEVRTQSASKHVVAVAEHVTSSGGSRCRVARGEAMPAPKARSVCCARARRRSAARDVCARIYGRARARLDQGQLRKHPAERWAAPQRYSTHTTPTQAQRPAPAPPRHDAHNPAPPKHITPRPKVQSPPFIPSLPTEASVQARRTATTPSLQPAHTCHQRNRTTMISGDLGS